MVSRTIGMLTAASLLCAGSAAAAGPAAPLSLAGSPAAARAGSGLEDAGALDRRGVGIYLIGAVVLGLIIWGIIELTGDEEDFPTSP